jgi:hypothetical protein
MIIYDESISLLKFAVSGQILSVHVTSSREVFFKTNQIGEQLITLKQIINQDWVQQRYNNPKGPDRLDSNINTRHNTVPDSTIH